MPSATPVIVYPPDVRSSLVDWRGGGPDVWTR